MQRRSTHRPKCSRPWAGCAGITRARRCPRARDDAGLRRRLRACATDEGGRADAARSPPRRRARPPRLVREGRVESLAIPRQLALEIERLAETPGLPAPSFSVALGGFPAGVHRQHADSPADNARPALFGHGGPLAPRIPGERRRWAAGASIALRPVVPRSARAGSGRPPRRRARRDAGPRSPAPTTPRARPPPGRGRSSRGRPPRGRRA